jgi:glucose/arabinose dehydrogenase
LRRSSLVVLALALALAAACSGGSKEPSAGPSTPPSSSGSPSSTATPKSPCASSGQKPPRGTISANFATALAFAPDGRLFYAERSGTVRVWQNGRSRVFARVATTTTEGGGGYSERGLLGLAISPTFDRDRFVYAFYSGRDRLHQYVIRWKDCKGESSGAHIIITVPGGTDCCHKGGRIAFGKDGMLYVTLGDTHVPSTAQNVSDLRGKLLRYRPDGGIPSDNPFGRRNPVWAYGFRNPFGLAISASGRIAITNNGPTSHDGGGPATGYDTVYDNVVRGRGYQWPRCYGYSHRIASSCGTGQSGPAWSSERSTVAPTGATWVDSSGPRGYAGRLVFCTYLAGGRILRPGSPHASVISGPSRCRFDIKQGPDHALYFSDAGHIYRFA